jgi:hypothetical protein
MNTTVRKPRDQGLSRVKKAIDSKQNPLSMWEIDFVRTSCCILDLYSEEVINRTVKRALEKGSGQAKRVMASIRTQLDDLGKRVENHKRAMPTPALATRTYDDMDVPGCRLAYLQTCAEQSTV